MLPLVVAATMFMLAMAVHGILMAGRLGLSRPAIATTITATMVVARRTLTTRMRQANANAAVCVVYLCRLVVRNKFWPKWRPLGFVRNSSNTINANCPRSHLAKALQHSPPQLRSLSGSIFCTSCS